MVDLTPGAESRPMEQNQADLTCVTRTETKTTSSHSLNSTNVFWVGFAFTSGVCVALAAIAVASKIVNLLVDGARSLIG